MYKQKIPTDIYPKDFMHYSLDSALL